MSKILGLDLGTTTLGIAKTDSLRIAAHGVETFRFEVLAIICQCSDEKKFSHIEVWEVILAHT